MSRSAGLRVGDMLDAARAAFAWCDGVSAAELAADPMRLAAVEWQLLVLGEAAKAVPEDVRALAPDVNWRRIVRLRDFLAHGYASIEPDELWEVVTTHVARDLPTLERLMLELLKRDASGGNA